MAIPFVQNSICDDENLTLTVTRVLKRRFDEAIVITHRTKLCTCDITLPSDFWVKCIERPQSGSVTTWGGCGILTYSWQTQGEKTQFTAQTWYTKKTILIPRRAWEILLETIASK